MNIKQFIDKVGNIPEDAEIWVSSDHGQQEESAYGVNFGLAEGEQWLCESCENRDSESECSNHACSLEWLSLDEIPEQKLKKVKRVLLW